METTLTANKQKTVFTDPLLENQFIKKLGGAFDRHPYQLNRILEADAEIICLDEDNHEYLVGKIDGIHEEINCGLYSDPFNIGWMSVTVTMSDIAAVGAKPTGILLLLQLTPRITEKYLRHLTNGIEAACKRYKTYILGGDTNFSSQFSIATSAMGSINGTKPMMRKGCKPGEFVYTTGKPGAGTAYAYDILFRNQSDISFQPLARLEESQVIRQFASACIDTSDGFIPAVANLSELNQIGFNIEISMSDLLCEQAFRTCIKARFPPWLMLAGPHGDYELLFTIPENKNKDFLLACAGTSWKPQYLGKTSDTGLLQLEHQEQSISLSPAKVANLFAEHQGNIPAYFKALMQFHHSIIPKNYSHVRNNH